METSTNDSNAKATTVKIESRSALDKTYQTELMVGTYSLGARVFSGLKMLGLCWAIAIFCVLIPILHFVLVPAALLAGIFMFFQRVSLSEYMLKGEVKCPNCGHAVPVKPGAFGWPKREICPGCRTDIFIEKP